MEVKAATVAASPVDQPDRAPDRIEYRIEAAATSADGDLALRPNFAFIINDRDVGERTGTLRDILMMDLPSEDGGHLFELGGTTDELDAYIRELKRRERRGLLTYVILDKTRVKVRKSSRKLRAPVEGVAHAVAIRLPVEPWPKGVHKEIAVELGISKSECSRAITLIREDPDLYALIGTIGKPDEPAESETPPM